MELEPQAFQCPETGLDLVRVADAEVRRLNDRIAAGDLVDASGDAVESPVDGVLRPEGRDFVYPIRDGIPVLLAEDRIPLPDDF